MVKLQFPYCDSLQSKIMKQYMNHERFNPRELADYSKITGVEKTYYEDGALLSETMYIRGEKMGLAMVYYESGKVRNKIIYKNDHENSIVKYDEAGNVIGKK